MRKINHTNSKKITNIIYFFCKKTLSVLVNATLLILIILLFSFIYQKSKYPNTTPNFLGFRPLIVLSGSMSPKLKVGDLIIVKDTKIENIRIGDILSYKSENNLIITHRVIQIENISDKLFVKTKGDANNIADETFVSSNQIVGVLSIDIPYAGYITEVLKNKISFTTFLLLPIIFLILSEKKQFKSVK